MKPFARRWAERVAELSNKRLSAAATANGGVFTPATYSDIEFDSLARILEDGAKFRIQREAGVLCETR